MARDDRLRPLNPDAADQVLDEIEHICRLIDWLSGLGRPYEGTLLRLHALRRYRFRIIYRPVGDYVEIREVLHSRQDMRGDG